jgi:hypothetical protein
MLWNPEVGKWVKNTRQESPSSAREGAQRLQIGMLFIVEKWIGNIFIERG